MKKDIIILDQKQIFCNKNNSNSDRTFFNCIQSIDITAKPNNDARKTQKYSTFSDESIHETRFLALFS